MSEALSFSQKSAFRESFAVIASPLLPSPLRPDTLPLLSPMKLLPLGLLALSLPLVAAEPPPGPAISTTPPPLTGEWKKIQVTDKFWAEGACVADVNKDGHMDILYGPYWYEGPDFKK